MNRTRWWLALGLAWGSVSLAQDGPPVKPAEPAQPPAAQQRTPVLERSVRDAAGLAARWPKQVRELQSQPSDTEPGERFLALWEPARTPTPEGVVILVPGTGESADWPRVVGPLREQLPDYGWHTLSLTLPDPPQDVATLARAPVSAPAITPEEPTAAEPSPADAPASDSPDADAAQTPPDGALPAEPGEPVATRRAERIAARLAAALAFAEQQQAAPVVLLAHGTGASWVVRYLQEAKPAAIKGLVVIDPAAPAKAEPPLEDGLAALEIPIGDFYYRSERADALATLRKNAARQRDRASYQQIGLTPIAAGPEHLLRRVRGWLDRTF